MCKLAIVGGGTGGHVFPGVAIAEAWLKHVEGGQVVFIGSPKGMEATLIPKLGYEFHAVEARRLKNTGFVERIRNFFTLPKLIIQGRKLLKSLNVDVVLGVGGYVSGPVVLAAALMGYPCAIAEQNARAGLTNRLLSRFVDHIYTAFEDTGLPAKKVRLLGNPVRASFEGAVEHAHEPGTGRRILILGGSQGAKALNERIPPIVTRLAKQYLDLEVIHQTGKERDEPVRALYQAEQFPSDHMLQVCPFIDHMEEMLQCVDLVVGRAGATSIAELAAMGRPSVLIPFPYAADDHQTKNAQSLVQVGAAILVPEASLDADELFAQLSDLFDNPAKLQAMGQAATKCGHPTAGRDIALDLLQLIQQKKAKSLK